MLDWILLILLLIIAFLIIWQFVGYPFLMALYSKRKKQIKSDSNFTPFVTILVPTFNEERVIERRIDNLNRLEYPKDNYEIIVVDSGSTDNTISIVEEIIRGSYSHPKVRIVKEKTRNGKASAINFGCDFAIGEIILVTDANCVFDEQVLSKIIPHFKNPVFGAVGGQFKVLNPEKNPLVASTQFYWDLEYLMRLGETELDSACLFHGEINAWRKDIVRADLKMLSEDLDMVLQIKEKGYKVAYEPEAVVYEPAPTTIEDQIKQRKRTSIGTIQCIFKHWRYLIIPRDKYRSLIFPSHKTLVVLSPFLLMAFILISAILIMLGKAILVLFSAISLVLIFGLLFWGLMRIKRKLIKNSNENANRSSISKLLKYVLLNEYLLLLAWRDFLLRRYSVLWEKASTTR